MGWWGDAPTVSPVGKGYDGMLLLDHIASMNDCGVMAVCGSVWRRRRIAPRLSHHPRLPCPHAVSRFLARQAALADIQRANRLDTANEDSRVGAWRSAAQHSVLRAAQHSSLLRSRPPSCTGCATCVGQCDAIPNLCASSASPAGARAPPEGAGGWQEARGHGQRAGQEDFW